MRGIRLAVLFLIFAVPVAWGQVTLPQQTGSINDYAAQLGIESRDRLEFLTTRLNSGAGINANILITLIDPFSNPSHFSSALWDEWGLPDDRAMLIAFIREENIWRFHWRSSPDLQSTLNELESAEMFERTRSLVSDRRIVHAAIEFYEVLSENFVGPEIEELPIELSNDLPLDISDLPDDWLEPDEANLIENLTTESIIQFEDPGAEASNSTLIYILAGILGSVILLFLIKLAFSLTCPECGGRLQKRKNSMRAFANQGVTQRHVQQVSYCSNCNYQSSR